MDDGKRTILVAALSAYADLLAKNTTRLDLEQGKGKGRASEGDVDLAAEIQNQIRVCAELTNGITDAASGDDIARTFEAAGAATKSPRRERSSRRRLANDWEGIGATEGRFVVDDAPFINPFTGLTVIPETGYEAGPSNEPPPPQREPPKPPFLHQPVPKLPPSIAVEPTREPPKLPSLSSHPLSQSVEQSYKVPIRPPPKPQHLRALPIVPPRPMTPLSKTLPPQRYAPPPPPILAPEPQQLRRSMTVPTTAADSGLARMSSVIRKPVAAEQQPEISSSELHNPQVVTSAVSPAGEPLSPRPSPVDWALNTPDSSHGVSGEGGHFPTPTNKKNYLHHIADLASKVVKAAGGMMSMTRTPSVYQSQSEISVHKVRLPAEAPVERPDHTIAAEITNKNAFIRPSMGGPKQASWEEEPPPAYDSLSRISRSSSFASISSAARSSISVAPTTFSSRTSLSSGVSRSTRSNSSTENYSSLAPFPAVTPFNLSRSKSQRASTHSLTSPTASRRAKPQDDRLGRRYTVSPVPSRPANFGAFVDGREIAHDLHLGNVNPMAWELPSAPSRQPPGIDHRLGTRNSNANRRQSTASPWLDPPGSNNPWRDHMAADAAYAKALQQEEYRDLQTERDQLLAFSIANGTAVDEDIELAYFMSRQTATLIESTDAVSTVPLSPEALKHAPEALKHASVASMNAPEATTHTQESSTHAPESLKDASLDIKDGDVASLQMQLDWLKARQLEKELSALDAADEASLSEARRLQAEFDQEVQNDDAWEDWKKTNIEECIVCGDEQHREELARPCEHGYCDGCLQEGFKNALASRAPLKCCKKTLSIKDCVGLSAAFITEYDEMMLELTTPNPMFCCNASCARFLPPRLIAGDVGTCDKCRSKTCRHCRRRVHPGSFCREDKETEAVKELARQKGWKTCPGCNHLIERQSGCLHMICSRCQTAFCYRCSKRWKDCESTCPDPISATHPKR